MSETVAAPMLGRRLLAPVADGFAIAGGLVLVAAILVTVASVVAARFGAPILGNTEIVEMAAGVAIAFFLPICQLRGGNVIVDFFTTRVPPRVRDGLDAVMTFLFALVVAVLTWRLIVGGINAADRNRVSMFLALPQWWGYAAAACAMVLWTAVCFYTAVEALMRARAPR